MKKLLFGLLPLVALSVLAQPLPPATTTFTRSMLRGTNASETRNILGFATTNTTSLTNADFDANQFNVTAGQLHIKTSAALTTPVVTGNLTADGFVGAGTNITSLNATNLLGKAPLTALTSPHNTNLIRGIVPSVLTNLNATNITGIIPTNTFPAVLPPVDGSQLTGIRAAGVATNVFYGNRIIQVDANGGSDESGVKGGFPFQTLRAAQAVAVPGDTIRVFPGLYGAYDLGVSNVNWYFEPGASVYYNGNCNTDSGAVFTDNKSGFWLCGVFAGEMNSMSYNIAGSVTATQLTGSFIKIGGPRSKINVEVNEIRAADPRFGKEIIVLLTDSYTFPYAATNADAQLNLRANLLEGIIYLGEHGLDLYSSTFSNTTFILDHDTDAERPNTRLIRGRECDYCNFNGGGSFNSLTIFDIPLWRAGEPFTYDSSLPIHGIGAAQKGVLQFKNITFIQHPTNTANLFTLDYGFVFAQPDFTNSAKMIFDNCRVIGRPGYTGKIVDWTNAVPQVTNNPMIYVQGQLAYVNATAVGIPTNAGPGEIVHVPGLTNFFTGGDGFGAYTPPSFNVVNLGAWTGSMRTNGTKRALLYTTVSYDDSVDPNDIYLAVFAQGGTTNLFSHAGINTSGAGGAIVYMPMSAPLSPNDRYFVKTNIANVVVEGPSYVVEW